WPNIISDQYRTRTRLLAVKRIAGKHKIIIGCIKSLFAPRSEDVKRKLRDFHLAPRELGFCSLLQGVNKSLANSNHLLVPQIVSPLETKSLTNAKPTSRNKQRDFIFSGVAFDL